MCFSHILVNPLKSPRNLLHTIINREFMFNLISAYLVSLHPSCAQQHGQWAGILGRKLQLHCITNISCWCSQWWRASPAHPDWLPPQHPVSRPAHGSCDLWLHRRSNHGQVCRTHYTLLGKGHGHGHNTVSTLFLNEPGVRVPERLVRAWHQVRVGLLYHSAFHTRLPLFISPSWLAQWLVCCFFTKNVIFWNKSNLGQFWNNFIWSGHKLLPRTPNRTG